MQNKNEKLEKEIIRMLNLSDFGKGKTPIIETKKSTGKLLKEDFIEDVMDIFNNDDDGQHFFTNGPKPILTMDMKAAMLAHSFKDVQAAMLGLNNKYNPRTKGSKATEIPGNIYDRPDIEKTPGVSRDYRELNPSRLKKDQNSERIPATFIDKTDSDVEGGIPEERKQFLAKWWNNKSYTLISATENGLTDLGRAQLEFLARAYTQKPIDDKEQTLFDIFKDKGNHFSEVAEDIIREFYSRVMIPYIMNLTKRAKFNPKDYQLKIFIEKGVNHALNQLPSHFDAKRGNLGSFIITTVKNSVINQLKEISEYKVDTSYVYEYLSSLHGPLTVQSIGKPDEVEGSYNDVKILKQGGEVNGKNTNTVYGYVYNNPIDALSDLTKDARAGGKPSPLAKHFIAGSSKSLFYKSFPPHYDDVVDAMDMHDVDPYEQFNVFHVNQLPQEAKKEVVKTLQQVLNIIVKDYKEYGVKNINSFIKANNEFVLRLMFDLLNYGDFVEVYTKTWVVQNEKGGTTKLAPMQPVKLITVKNGQKQYAPNIAGVLPSPADTTWVWSSGQKSEEEVKQNFLNKFVAKMSARKLPDGSKPIPPDFMKNSQDIMNKLYGAMRFYFGFQGKTSPVIKQNRDQLNTLLRNYSTALSAEQLSESQKLSIVNVFKNLIK